MIKYLIMIAMVMSGFSGTALSQTKKKQWCCKLGSKVASFKSQGEKTFGKVRHICLDSKNRPSSPTSIYVKKCKRVSGRWMVTPEVGAIQIVENYAKPNMTKSSARKYKSKVRTKSVAKKGDTPSARQKKKAKKKRVTSGAKKTSKSVASAKKTRSKVAKKARGKTGAKPKKKIRKKTKKKTKAKAASN